MENKNFDGMEQPSWYDGKMIDEVAFCASFLHQHPMKCVRGRLFTVDGMIEDEGKIQQMILDEVMTCQSIGIAKKIKSLFDAVKLMAYSDPLPIETDRIHVANGTYFLDGTFTEDKTYCNNRMKVNYNPNAPQPQRLLHFLSDLLVPEDIPTLQEYLGYCLILNPLRSFLASFLVLPITSGIITYLISSHLYTLGSPLTSSFKS